MKIIYKVKFEDLEILEYWVSVCIEQFTGNNTNSFLWSRVKRFKFVGYVEPHNALHII